MRKSKNKNVSITLNMNKDDVEIGKDSMHITTENGIKIQLPYERLELEGGDRIIGLKNEESSLLTKNKKNK